MKKIENVIVIPAEDKYTPVKVAEAKFIHDLILEKKLKNTLEIGFAYGRSASYIITATKSKHIAIDPFQDNYNNLGLENLKQLGLDQYLDFQRDYSHNVLPKLVGKEEFDFIFVDGSHQFDGVFVDFYYADLLLRNGGYVMFHDTWMRGIALTVSWIRKNRSNYRIIKTPLRNIALFVKQGNDERGWTHFKEFYTRKAMLTHYLISWMTKPEKSLLQKLLIKIKDAVK